MTATVIPFPARRQAGKVRKVASAMLAKAGERRGGEGYWLQIVEAMGRRMEAAGIDGDIIDREIVAFRDAVGAEMGRLQHQCGGAAS